MLDVDSTLLSTAVVLLNDATVMENITIGSYDQEQLRVLVSPGSLTLQAVEGQTAAPLAVFQEALRSVSYFTTSET